MKDISQSLVPSLLSCLLLGLACSNGQTGDAGLGVDSANGEGGSSGEGPSAAASDDDAVAEAGSGDDAPAPSGGCDPYACDCGLGRQSNGGPDTPPNCVGSPLCNEDQECPAARGGDVQPTCQSNGDLVQNGYTGSCVLSCDRSEVCPQGMECISSRCAFVTGAVPQGGDSTVGMVTPSVPASSGPTGVPGMPEPTPGLDGPCSGRAGMQPCAGGCVDIVTDPLHCGACNAACAPGVACSGGVCTQGGDAGSPLGEIESDAGVVVSDPPEPPASDAGFPVECYEEQTTEECFADHCAECAASEVCLLVATGASYDYRCDPNPCAPQPLSSANGECSECAADLCQGISCTADANSIDCIRGRCNSPDTPISTRDGERPIAELRPGDMVYSMHQGRLTLVPIERVGRTAVSQHEVVRLTLDDEMVLEISATHPTADGRALGAFEAGDSVGERRVVSAVRVPYQQAFTYDILPASDSGTYLAGGVLLGSTLFPGSVSVDF